MKDVARREQRLTEVFWDCGAARCPTKHTSSVAAQRCPARLQDLRQERLAQGETDRDLLERIAGALVASCTCLTKTPEPRYHKDDCRYRVLFEAHQRISELEQTFKLRWDADMRAIQRWREEDPRGRELRQPDHADLVVWLLELIQELDQDRYDQMMDSQFEGYHEQ